jgi:uncharacterized protein YcfJ
MKKLILILLALTAFQVNADQLYGRVTNVIANYQSVVTAQPSCQYVTRYGNNSGLNGGSILGAVVGGILGNQIGGGRGQMVATGVGVVVGGSVGTRMSNHMSNNANTQMLCKDVYVPQQVRTGYMVTIASQGHYFNVNMDHNPGVGARLPLSMQLQ